MCIQYRQARNLRSKILQCNLWIDQAQWIIGNESQTSHSSPLLTTVGNRILEFKIDSALNPRKRTIWRMWALCHRKWVVVQDLFQSLSLREEVPQSKVESHRSLSNSRNLASAEVSTTITTTFTVEKTQLTKVVHLSPQINPSMACMKAIWCRSWALRLVLKNQSWINNRWVKQLTLGCLNSASWKLSERKERLFKGCPGKPQLTLS